MDNDFTIEDWNGYSYFYDALNEIKPYQEMQADILQKISLTSGQKILDCACGSGNLVFWAKEIGLYQGAKIFGLDISPEMLDLARKKTEQIYKSLDLANLNTVLPFPNNFFDQAVSTLTLYALPRPIFFLQEIKRVLKKDGRLILTTPKCGYENGLILKAHCNDKGPDEFWLNAHESPEREKAIIKRAISDHVLASKIISIANYNRTIKKSSTFYFPTQSELIKLLSDQGFAIINATLTYAEQDHLITAIKETHNDRD